MITDTPNEPFCWLENGSGRMELRMKQGFSEESQQHTIRITAYALLGDMKRKKRLKDGDEIAEALHASNLADLVDPLKIPVAEAANNFILQGLKRVVYPARNFIINKKSASTYDPEEDFWVDFQKGTYKYQMDIRIPQNVDSDEVANFCKQLMLECKTQPFVLEADFMDDKNVLADIKAQRKKEALQDNLSAKLRRLLSQYEISEKNIQPGGLEDDDAPDASTKLHGSIMRFVLQFIDKNINLNPQIIQNTIGRLVKQFDICAGSDGNEDLAKTLTDDIVNLIVYFKKNEKAPSRSYSNP